MNSGIRIFIILTLMTTLFSSAVIPYVAHYRLGNKECYLLFDVHRDLAGSNLSEEQRDTLLTEGKKKQATFVIEDMFTYHGNDADVKNVLALACMVLGFDAPLVHAWYTASLSTNQVVVYAGGEHSRALETLLIKQGYTKIAEQGSSSYVKSGMQLELAINKDTILSTSSESFFALIAACRLFYRNCLHNFMISNSITAAKKIDLKKIFNDKDKA